MLICGGTVQVIQTQPIYHHEGQLQLIFIISLVSGIMDGILLRQSIKHMANEH